MDNKQGNKKTIIISVILICATLVFGVIYQLNRNNVNTNKTGDYFHDYEINEVQKIIVSLREVSNRYLADFVNNVIYYPKDVYNMLDESTKEKYSGYEDFEVKIRKMFTSDFLEAQVVSFTDGVVDGKRAIYVVDKSDNNYVFIENSINNYVIKID